MTTYLPENQLRLVRAQLDAELRKHPSSERPRVVVTLSRETGAGAITVGRALADYMTGHAPKGAPPWTVFDRNLIEKVLEDHDLPKKLAEYMPEDARSDISDVVEELFGLHPVSWQLVQRATETILKLARLGNVVLVGRGAQVVTARLPHAFHVRLVGSLETRAARIQEFLHIDREAAIDHIEKEDAARRRFCKKYFRKDVDDLLLYHLVINTDLVLLEEAARLIGHAVLDRWGEKPAG